MPAVSFCLLGLALGLRHAFEPDHLAAMSTLVAEDRGARRAAALGALWGLGHTASLLAVGIVLAAVEAQLPPRLSHFFDLAVASMLVLVGLSGLKRALGKTLIEPAGLHARRSLMIGIVHGLAGSGSLTALVVANLSSTSARLAYMALFGAGLVAGMALLSGVVGWPLARLARHSWAGRAIGVGAGALSLALGLVWAYPLLAGVQAP
jgi:hypothetical protein